MVAYQQLVSSAFSDILVLPKPKETVAKKKGRIGLITSATSITDDDFLSKLKAKEKDKEENKI